MHSRVAPCARRRIRSLRTRPSLGRKFELVHQSSESWLIAYSVVSGEYYRRSQERLVFGQSCLQPFEGSGCFIQPEINPCNGQRWAVTSFATGFQLPEHAAGFGCVSEHSGNITKVALAQRQPIVELSARVGHAPSFVL